jgi:WD40 repeat protein
MIRLRTIAVSVVLVGCGTHGKQGQGSGSGTETRSIIESCIAGGGQLSEIWSTSNLHGPVDSITVGGSIIVLGSQDGSVKQWSVSGQSADPTYGTPFAEVDVPVYALAIGADGKLVGADQLGRLDTWEMATAAAVSATNVDEYPLSALALSADATQAAAATGLQSPNMWLVDRTSGTVSAKLPTGLWGVSSFAFGGGALFSGGHFYGSPMVERRTLDAPTTVASAWQASEQLSGKVNAIALDHDVTTLVAVGDGFVAVLPTDDLSTGPTVIATNTGHTAVGVALLSGNELFATAGRDGDVALWKTDTAERVATVTAPAAVGIGVDQSGEHLFTSGADGLLHAFACH